MKKNDATQQESSLFSVQYLADKKVTQISRGLLAENWVLPGAALPANRESGRPEGSLLNCTFFCDIHVLF